MKRTVLLPLGVAMLMYGCGDAMLPTGLARSALETGKGPFLFVITLRDLRAKTPLGGVSLQVTEGQSCSRAYDTCKPKTPLRFGGSTDAAGRLELHLPHGRFGVQSFTVRNYIGSYPFHNLSEAERKLDLLQTRETDSSRELDFALIPARSLRVTTDAQARALAVALPEIQSWLSAHPQYQSTAREGVAEWEVGFGLDGKTLRRLALVDSLFGTARILGSWGD
jgi:hypothetical protein